MGWISFDNFVLKILSEGDDDDDDKGTFIAPYLLRAHRRIAYFTTKREI